MIPTRHEDNAERGQPHACPCRRGAHMAGTGRLPQPAERQPDARLLTFLTGWRGLEIHQPMIPQSHHLRTGGAPGTTLHGLSPKLKADGDAPTAAWCERGASWRKRAPKGSVPREGAVIREDGRWKAAVRAPASRRSGHGQGGVRAALGDACPRGALRSVVARGVPSR